MQLHQSQPKKSVIERAAGILFTIDEAFIENDWHVVRLFPLESMQNRGRQLDEAGGIGHRENQDQEGTDDVRRIFSYNR